MITLGHCPDVPRMGPHCPCWGHAGWMGTRAGRVLASTPTDTGLELPPLAKISEMGESPPMVCLHLHQAGLGVCSWLFGASGCPKTGNTHPVSSDALACCFQLAQSWTGACNTTMIPCLHQHPAGISAHPKALPKPGSWEQEDRLESERQATVGPRGTCASSAHGGNGT